MNDNGSEDFSLTPAEWSGLVAILVAILIFFWDMHLAIIPLAGFLVICVTAPFFPRLSFYLQVISRGKSGKQAVALTFDDGPDPLSTPELLHLLSRYQVKATFFVTGERSTAYPELIEDILLKGHSIGNHTYTHDNLILLRSSKQLFKEIKATQDVLLNLGIMSFAFRPLAGVTNPRLRKALKQLNIYIVNFSCRAFDGGNRWITHLSKKILKKIRPDDIILLHDVPPKKENLLYDWLKEVEQILAGLEAKGLKVLPLSEIIGKSVMATQSGNPLNEK